ncbi:MAG: DUF4243 domain-containing protein [Actinobacteria bacterium]|nr:DUF4243 domain-containing protein [Actinomycetota bacterium]
MTPPTGDGVLDEALEILAGTGPEYPPFGFSNHGPMAAEALVALGRDDAVLPWVEGYRDRLAEGPAPGAQLGDEWVEALGNQSRLPDWVATFSVALAEAPWTNVVGQWAPRLLPGVAADAFHGVIRTAHAIRALEGHVNELRTAELAQGLAVWATGFQALPGRPAAGSVPLGPADALAEVRVLTDEERGQPVSIVEGLGAVGRVADFEPVIRLPGAPENPAAYLTDLVDLFVRVARRQMVDPLSTIVFVHTVTGPSAVAVLLPHLDGTGATAATQYAWQATAGLYAAYADPTRTVDNPPVTLARDDLVDRAVATGDEHAIKFTETCLRSGGSEAFRADAAAHAIGFL